MAHLGKLHLVAMFLHVTLAVQSAVPHLRGGKHSRPMALSLIPNGSTVIQDSRHTKSAEEVLSLPQGHDPRLGDHRSPQNRSEALASLLTVSEPNYLVEQWGQKIRPESVQKIMNMAIALRSWGLSPTATLPSFYIYKDLAMNTTALLAGCTDSIEWPSYVDVNGPLLEQLEVHKSRAEDPNKAQWFIVPFDFDRNQAVGSCNGTSSEMRVTRALDALESSPHFKHMSGKNHLMLAMRWRIFPGWPDQSADYFPPTRRGLLQHMVVGQYMDYHLRLQDKVWGFNAVGLNETSWWRQGYDWRCTLVLPVQSASGLWKPDQPFNAWNSRTNVLFFRGHGSQQCMHGAEDLRKKAASLQGIIPNSIFDNKHADTFEQYVQEITSSKFCLVMRCDDPQTSRFVDALAAGCIPVIVSDGMGLAAMPFHTQINYDAFTITIPETMWNYDTVAAAHFAYNWPEAKMRQMHSAMQEARQHLLWNHPSSQVASAALADLTTTCPP
mmetsp:Transcript_66553/g.124168  ORF Transcript_66553/g.124168 Transcript_66553/m.124168 type:complete len:496 (+) Transcript_66553:132-1619(+)